MLLLVSLMAVTVGGYQLLGGAGVSFLQALYMAVITLAGVGYGEIVDTSTNPALRVFNMGVILVGVTLMVYVFSVVTALLVEVELTNPFWRRRMQKHIDQLADHYIICGMGDTGRFAVEELKKTGTSHVVVESSEEHIKRLQEQNPEWLNGLLYVVGDATEEETLEKAGITRARGLVAALPQGKDNLVITVLVHQRFPLVRIVARASDQKLAQRMQRAGASATVSPSHIGGLRMASELIRPHAVSFLDLMLRDPARTLRVEQVEIEPHSAWVGQALAALDLRGRYNLMPMAIKPRHDATAKFLFNPPDTTLVPADSVLIVMGDVADLQRARVDAGQSVG